MMTSHRTAHTVLVACAVLTIAVGCGESAKLPFAAGVGPNPTLPPPRRTLLPTTHVASATGWPPGVTPVGAAGTVVTAFATDLAHPRWVYVLPNGDVLVAESSAPPKPEDSTGLKGWAMRRVYKKVGAAVPSANRITLLRDADGDGVPEVRTAFLENLSSPIGMALVGRDFYVANTDALVRFPYVDGATRIESRGEKILDLPGRPFNHHWTKNVIASADGARLYVTVGSNSNVGERGMQHEAGRAAIWEVDLRTGGHQVFASGLRNPNGLAWEPTTGALWTVVNERDEIGSDLVPDYLTAVRDGGFYGWPYSYFGHHVDRRVQPPRPDLVASALVPDYALGTHVAPLGLAFSARNTLPPQFATGMFIGQHGSWNRKPRSGYNVVFVPFRDGRPVGTPIDVLAGVVNDEADEAYGRPVGVAIDGRGALLVADDVGNAVWRVAAADTRRTSEEN